MIPLRSKLRPPEQGVGPIEQAAIDMGATVATVGGPPPYQFLPHVIAFFEDVAETGSIFTAAKANGISPGAVRWERATDKAFHFYLTLAEAMYREKIQGELHQAAMGKGRFAEMPPMDQAKIALGLFRELSLQAGRQERADMAREAAEAAKNTPTVIEIKAPRARRLGQGEKN